MYYTDKEKNEIVDSFYKINIDIIEEYYDLKITSKDLFNYNKSIQEAERSNHSKFRVGAVIVDGNKIISKKFNEMKTHPIQKYYNDIANNDSKVRRSSNCIHAEVNAIISASKKNFDGNNSTIYIGRINKENQLLCSFPCHSCYTAIKDYGISRIVCMDPYSRLVSFYL